MNDDYIRESAKKCGWKKYYMQMCPVSIGTHPKDGMMDFINYDTRVEKSGHMVWAEIYYDRELTAEELEEFEMLRG